MSLFVRKLISFTGVVIIIYITAFAALFFVSSFNIPLVFRITNANILKGGFTYVSFRQFDKAKKYDVILLGSSHAYRGYDPAIFREYGYRMFNLGTNSQGNLVSYVIAKNYINKSNCSTVILDVYDRVFTTTRMESLSDVVQNINSTEAAVDLCLASKDIRLANMLTMRMFNQFDFVFNDDTAGVKEGYIPYLTQLSLNETRRETGQKPAEEALVYFEKLIEYLHGEGINIILAEQPVSFLATIPVQQHQELLKKIHPILEKYHIPFYDHLYDSSLSDIKYFANSNHLSVSGIEKYNHLLIKELLNDGRLKK